MKTKELLREWLTGLLMGGFNELLNAKSAEQKEAWWEKGKESQKKANEIIRFLEDYDFFDNQVRDD